MSFLFGPSHHKLHLVPAITSYIWTQPSQNPCAALSLPSTPRTAIIFLHYGRAPIFFIHAQTHTRKKWGYAHNDDYRPTHVDGAESAPQGERYRASPMSVSKAHPPPLSYIWMLLSLRRLAPLLGCCLLACPASVLRLRRSRPVGRRPHGRGQYARSEVCAALVVACCAHIASGEPHFAAPAAARVPHPRVGQ